MKSKILLLLSLLFINYTNSQNLIANPGFELGSSGVGFVTNGAGYTQLTAPYTGTSVPGNFAVVNNPKLINTTNYISEGDHTTGTGNMLVIDGSTNTTSPRFWRAGDTGSGVTGLNIGTIYFFSYWIKSVSNLGNPANISLSVTGGTAPVLLSGTATAPAPAQSWRQVVYSFTATATSATIELWNTNTIASGVGNDFAVDDFMLTDDLIISYNVTNAVCSVGNNGSVTVSAFGGTPPYVNYNITGPGATNVNNLTGVFSGLQPGVYTVSVTDSSLPTAITTTLTNVVVGPTITIFTSNSNTAIACAGSPITLTASGSTASYSWTASPTDPTLTTPLIANPIVTPTVPTTYTVTSTIGSCAQISRSVQVGINPLPTASISGTTTLCNGSTTLITFTGTPNATVTYKINGGANLTIVLDAAGNATLTTPAITSQAVYSLVSVTSAGPPFCTQTVVGSVKISVDIQLGVTANPNPICVGGTSALRATGFTFSTASGVPLNPMVGATNILSSGNDNNPSSATNIGFNFNFGGIDYTQFSVSPDGWLLLGGAVAVSQPNNVTTNVQNTPKLYPFWDDLATGSNGSVNVLVTGTAPNRIFIIEWNVTIPKNVAGAANSTFQMWLYETTNVIEYHYGTMGVQTSNSISGGYTVSAANYSSITFNSNSASTSVPNDANTTTPSSGTTYTYAPLSSLIWSPTTNLFNDAAATIAYTGDSRAVVYATNVPDAGATYLVTGANGAGCTATANINIVVSKPVVTSPNPSATVTICPGNTASFTIVGTAFSTVTFTNPTVTPATGPINIPLTGSVVFTTPILNESVVYTLTEIRSFLTGCTTAPLNITLTVNVVPNGCATVGTVPAPGTRPLDLTLCTPGECRTLQADVSPVPSTTSYSVASIPYCPQAAFENPTWNNILPGGPIGDDDWSAPFSFPAGMNFCFYGQNYTQLNVGTNQVIHFPNPALFAAGDFCPWQYNQTIPSTTFPITNAIFGVYQDTDFSVTPPPGTQISVNYNVIGTYPCRKFIANFTNCPQFSCGNTIGLSTSQIVLYEVSNIIEVYVQRRVACTGWNNGNGTIGVIDGTGAQGVAAPGRNAAPFSTDPTPTNPTNSDNVSEAWRFTPTGPPVSQTINWYEGPVSAGNQIGTGPTIQVCPTVTTTYTLQTVFNVCGVPQTATTTQTLNVTPDLTGTPVDITRCTNIFDLTVNDGIILGSLNPLDYEISYHTSAVEANTGSNPIANPAAYSPGINFGTYPVWACIYLNSSNCRVVKPFDLIYDNCSVVVEDVPDLVLCDDSSADGSTTFNLTSQTAIALGTNSPTDYTITYHTSLTDANDDINPISPISGYNNTSNPQTIWIRMEENIAPTQYATETFTLTVKPLPTATISGTRTVCKDDASPNITFTGADGTAPYTFVYSTDGGATTITTGPSTGNTLTIPVSTATAGVFTYTLISVEDSGPPACSQNQSGTATVTVNPLPTATISGTISVCKDAPSPNITFTGANGTAPYTFVYSTDGGATTITTPPSIGNTITVPASTANVGTVTYTLISVQSSGTPICSQNQSGSASVTVIPLPTATISGTTTVCKDDANPNITFTGANGTAPYTFVYSTDGGTTTITTGPSTGNTLTIPVPTATAGVFTYTLISVQESSTLACSQNQSGTAIVTVNPLPTATISGTISVCKDAPSPNITFTGANGTAPYTFVYSTDGGATTITTPPSIGNTITVPASTANVGTVTYTLVSVQSAGTPVCSQNQSGSASITVIPLPTATISGTTSVCKDDPNPNITFTGANGTAPYTFVYSTDGGATTITTGPSTGNIFTVSVPTATAGVLTYTLISVQDSGTLACSQNQSGTATVTVNPLPTAIISGTTAVCMGAAAPSITFTGANGTPPYTFFYTRDTVPMQITTASATASSVSLPIPSTAAATTYIYNLVGVEDSSSTTCSQNQSGTATVTVIAAPIIGTPTNYVVCDDSLNNDGLYCAFDLTTKDIEISTDPNVDITYHETPTDASTGGNPIPAIPLYCNIDSGSQTIYVRVFNPSAPLCYSTTTFDLIINPIPLPNPVITDYELCDYTNPGDGVEIFNLGSKSVEIANSQPNVTITYYESLTDAQTQNNPLSNLYQNIVTPLQQIWINIRDNATGCNTTGTFDLIVNPLPVANTPPAIFECSNGTTLTAQFDLTVNEGFVKGGLPGFTISYFRTLAEAQTPFNPILTPTSYTGNEGDVIIIRLQNDATGCYSTTTQLLRVTQGPLAVTPTALQYCDPNNDGFGVFDLDSKILEIQGGTLDPNVTVTFHETPDDAYIGANGLVSPYDNIDPWSQIIYVRVFYTLTGCANYVQLKLNVNPTPEATEPADYELCDYSAPAGVEVFDLTTRIPEILGSINPALTTVTFYTNLPDAQAPSNAIAGITNYLSGNTTLYVRVETTATGCFDIVTLNLVVNPLPNSLQPNYPQYSLCDTDQSSIGYETFNLGSKITDILLGQGGMDVTFWRSLGDAQNRTNEITNLMYENAIPYVQTIGIIITNRTTGCFVISTMDLRVEPLPTPIPPAQPYTICDDNQDGFSCGFDLSTLIPDILQGANYTLTFYETPTDAATANTATDIDPTQPYCNNDPFMQLLYVRAEDNVTHCFTVMPIQLMVDPSPIAPISLNDIVVCDDDNNPQSATKLVDLTQRTPDVLSQQPLPATNYTVTYYTSQLNAETPTGEIIPANSYFGSDGEQIWVRVENNATQCFNTGSFFLVINTPLLLTFPTPLSVCDDDANPNDQYHVFDLTVKNLEIAPGGQTVTYYPSLALAQAGVAGTEITTPTAYQNMNPQHPAVQTLGVVVTTADGCKSITTLDIRVLPIPTPRTNPPALAPKCDDNNPGDMLELFDLTVNEAYIKNSDPNLTLHYYRTLADAQLPQNEIMTPTSALVGSNVWIRVENNRVDYLGNHCYVLVEQALTVNPLPTVIQPLAPYRMCDDNADGLALFDLTNPILAPLILGTATTNQQPADYTITYHLTPGNAASGTAPLVSPYPNVTPTTQNIYIRVVNNATGCVNATGVLTLAVEAYATATSPPPFETCDTYADPYDGVYEIDLTQFETAILNGQNPAVFLVSYYRTQADADAGTNPLTAAEELAYITDPDTDTIWVKVENSSNSITPYCYALATIVINVERYPNPIINTPNGVTTICVDFVTGAVIRPLTLDSGITNTSDYTFEWFEAANPTVVIGTNPTYTVDTPATGGATRSYTVHVTSISALGCDTTSAPFDVIQSGPAVIPSGTIGYTVTNAFSNQQIITVIAEGYGTYEYSLDDGPRQTSNVFENVSIGVEHTIHVWDTEGGIAYSCEELIIGNVNIIDYPHYFTPNGDGIHDTWNIWGLQGQPAAKIFIFDRYGKLLKQISSKGAGWDGTYNGHLLPSDDYWFTVDFEENSAMRQFKAHFTLKR